MEVSVNIEVNNEEMEDSESSTFLRIQMKETQRLSCKERNRKQGHTANTAIPESRIC